MPSINMATFSNSSYSSSNYASFRPTYSSEFFQYLAKWAPNTDLAVDVGCGPGTATNLIAKYVARRTVGVDPSAVMLETAKSEFPDLDFRVGTATDLTTLFEPNSVDLVTVAEAVHWFDLPQFFDQVRTILKPGGKLAIWAYVDPEAQKYPKLRDDVRWMSYSPEALGNYWDAGRQHLTDSYKDIELPSSFKVDLREIVPGTDADYAKHPLQIKRSLTASQFVSLLRTFSSYTNWRTANPGTKDPVDDCAEKMKGYGITDDTNLDIQWDTSLILAYKLN